MLTGILTLLSSLSGGFLRILPELLTWLNKKTDNKHELDVLDRQAAIAEKQGADHRAAITLQGDIDERRGLLDANVQALKHQFQKTGNKWADAANFLVRPVVTYFFLLMYGLVKLSTLVLAMQQTDAWRAILQCWSEYDAATFSGILSFYFVGRVLDKRAGR